MATGSCCCPTSCNRGCLLSCMAAEEVDVAAGTTIGATGYFCHRRKVCQRRDWNSSPLPLKWLLGCHRTGSETAAVSVQPFLLRFGYG
ncbi:uncharacterized protein LOC110277875 isoform X2 [Arachis duranensis]|uniref:Uncharacterized protein LOC110277875 isoform X2 n=1 Tax=Arachis duranensis TaxID=130453 RepID=A0A9C6TES2_ARADU|nr:uncharacterized protein LOC110277875 isoform X2 [Arachis duranensis]